MTDDVDDEAPTPAPSSARSSAPQRVDTVLQEPLAPAPTQLEEPTRKRLRHDPREVRRVLAMAFSSGELSLSLIHI